MTTFEPKEKALFLRRDLLNQIHTIAEGIIALITKENDDILSEDIPGIELMFAYLSKIFPEKNYSSVLFDLLEELVDFLSTDELDYRSVARVGFVFQHLRNIGILDNTDDLNLSELDRFIEKGAHHDFLNRNWDPLHGLVSLGIYFLERNKETGEKKYLQQIVDHLAAMRLNFENYRLWVTYGNGKSNDNYNFGMAHGMPGILSFLSQVHQRKIAQQDIEEMISSCLSFLLAHEFKDDPVYSFPYSIDVRSRPDDELTVSRLAWCYGDLCLANTLIHCGRALKRDYWTQRGIEVALKTTRRSFEDSHCIDAPFCHGSVGIAHQYHRLYNLTGNNLFRQAASRWIDLTQTQFYKPGEGAGGYYFRDFIVEKNVYELVANYSLLEGSAGIALVYLSYLFDIKPEWDILFLCNV